VNASGITREIIPNAGTDIKLEIIFSYFDSCQNLTFLRYPIPKNGGDQWGRGLSDIA